MKKIVLCMLVSLGIWQASAQEFHIIPKVGLNLSKTVGVVDSKTRPGLNIGVSGEMKLSSKFALESGVFYSSQGAKYEVIDVIMPKYEKWEEAERLDYINIPIYAKYYVVKGFHLFAGPQLGFNVIAKSKVDIDGKTYSEDIKENVNTLNIAIGAGLGYQFNCGLLISANYNFGLTHILKVLDQRQNVAQINLGWRF